MLYYSQNDIYGDVRGCTAAVIEGINATVFAYGQTGSGKVDNTLIAAL